MTVRSFGRVVFWIAGVLVLIGALAYGGLVFATNRMLVRKVTVPADIAAIAIPEGNPAAIDRGKYLVDHVLGCADCHGSDLGGKAAIDDPMVGHIWAKNLTAGAGSAVRDYQAADWVRTLRHGVGRDGRRLIVMPSEDFVTYTDDDLGAVVAYIKSLPPVDREDHGVHPGPLGRVLLATGQVAFAYDKIDHLKPRPEAEPGPTRQWGEVLVGSCRGCHGETLSGGAIPGGPPDWPPARNITPDSTGLAGWTFDQFEQAFRHGTRPDGTVLRVMPWKAYAGMTDADVTAIWHYLQTVTPKTAGGR